MTLSYPMIIMFVIYIFVMLLIGFWAYRSTTSFDDYILGEGRLGGVVTALSAGASDISG
uniref:Sodium/proline symporter n=1 Tax=Arsenophonus endosymbiont of Trialeurodes vaporariorum TaxID=235567 RepID=A0A3B0M5U7_9GAMM